MINTLIFLLGTPGMTISLNNTIMCPQTVLQEIAINFSQPCYDYFVGNYFESSNDLCHCLDQYKSLSPPNCRYDSSSNLQFDNIVNACRSRTIRINTTSITETNEECCEDECIARLNKNHYTVQYDSVYNMENLLGPPLGTTLLISGISSSNRRKLFDIDWKPMFQSGNWTDWETSYAEATYYKTTFKVIKLCTDYGKDFGVVSCVDELVIAENVSLNVASETVSSKINRIITKNYRYVYVELSRHVHIQAESTESISSTTCFTSNRSSIEKASSNVTLSNAFGVYAPNSSLSKNAEVADVYFYSGRGEEQQYICRDYTCSTHWSIPAFPTDPIEYLVDGTRQIGGSPTQMIAFGDIYPQNKTISAVLEVLGEITPKTETISLEWNTTYGAIFEHIRDVCTVSSYAINLRVIPDPTLTLI